MGRGIVPRSETTPKNRPRASDAIRYEKPSAATEARTLFGTA